MSSTPIESSPANCPLFNREAYLPVKEKPKGQVRIYVDMVGDLFHAGHINMIRRAKKLGNYLIVGLIGDDVCENYKRRPILTLNERCHVIGNCQYVDGLIPDSPLVVTEEFLEEYKIDYVVHGDDYTEEQVKKYYGVPFEKGMYKTFPYTPGVSTSEIIKRAWNRYNESLAGKTVKSQQLRKAPNAVASPSAVSKT